MPSHHFTSLCSSSTQPWPCGSALSRSGLCRHGAVQLCAPAIPIHAIQCPLRSNHINVPAVALADHCVTVRARPPQCRSDHLMTPTFRLTSGHNSCSAIPCKTAHPQSLRISSPRSRFSSPFYPLPRLVSSAPCCAAADLCQSMPIAVPNAPCPSCSVQCPHLAHLPSATRSVAALIRAMPSRPALPLSASQLFNALSPHYSAPQGPCIAPRHTVSLRITHCRIKHTRALLYICFPGLNKALPSPRVPRHFSAPAQPRSASLLLTISLPPPRLS